MKRLVLILSLTTLAPPAFGQHWTKLYYPDSIVAITPYFINSNIGFAFNTGIEYGGKRPRTGSQWFGALPTHLLPNLRISMDGGGTWKVLPFFDTIGCSITQLCFVSPRHGYAATIPIRSNTGGIYETEDQGVSWKKLTPDGLAFSGVYATRSTIFASNIYDSDYSFFNGYITASFGPILYSRDAGATWDSISHITGAALPPIHQFQWIGGNLDSIVATICFSDPNGPNYLIYSSDLGDHWQSTQISSGHMVAFRALPHLCTIIQQHDDGKSNDTYSFLGSVLPYSRWDSLLVHLETGAWVAGNSCALYIPYAGSDSSGSVERSTNSGISWHSDGAWGGGPGPTTYTGLAPSFCEIDDYDYANLSVVGFGSIIYGCDQEFKNADYYLWKSTDGGDGLLSTAALAPRESLAHFPFPSASDTLELDLCAPTLTGVTTQNIACSYATFDSIVLVGLDPSEYSVTSTHYCGCTPMPDTSLITLTPTQAGTRDVQVHFHYTDDEFNQIDTSLKLTLAVKAGGNSISINVYLKDAIAARAGDTISIPIYLSGTAMLPGQTNITLPFTLDTNLLRVLAFDPANASLTADSMVFSNGTYTLPIQATDLTLNGERLVGWLRCVVYLSDTLATSVSVSNPMITTEGANCVALATDGRAVNIALHGCGNATLLKFMQTGLAPQFLGITPNPADNVLHVLLKNDHAESIRLSVRDALGSTRFTKSTTSSNVMLDVSSLVSGVYYLELGRSIRTVIVSHP